METAAEWRLTAEARPDYDTEVRGGGKHLRCYRHGQAHGLRVVDGETLLRGGGRSAGTLQCGALVLPLFPPHTHGGMWFCTAGYLAVAQRPGHAVRVLRRRFFG